MASVPDSAELLMQFRLLASLLNLLRSQQEDDEFVLQVNIQTNLGSEFWVLKFTSTVSDPSSIQWPTSS